MRKVVEIKAVAMLGYEGSFQRHPLIKETGNDGRCEVHNMKFLSTSLERPREGVNYRRVDLFYCQFCLYHVTTEYQAIAESTPWWYRVNGGE
jgi:hypothetical protein